MTIGAAYAVAQVTSISFGLILLIASGIFALAMTGWAEVESGDIRFWFRYVRRGTESFPLQVIVTPQTPTSIPAIFFTTTTEDRQLVHTRPHPVGVSFRQPVEQNVSRSQLPCKIKRSGLTIFQVERFVEDGFVVSNQRPGIEVLGYVSYEGDPSSTSAEIDAAISGVEAVMKRREKTARSKQHLGSSST